MNARAKVLLGALLGLVVALGVQLGIQLRITRLAKHQASVALSEAYAIERVRGLAQDDRREWASRFLGIPLMQYPNDLMKYQLLVFGSRPEVVIETGTASGGLTVYLAMLLENIEPSARVLSVDIKEANGSEVLSSPNIRQSLKDRIRFFQGSSTDPTIVAEMALLAKGKRVMVILDSLHTREHVRNELEMYAPLVGPGGYIMVNDTHLSQLKGAQWLPLGDDGPGPALRDFLASHAEYETITTQPDYMVSCMLGGIIRRVR